MIYTNHISYGLLLSSTNSTRNYKKEIIIENKITFPIFWTNKSYSMASHPPDCNYHIAKLLLSMAYNHLSVKIWERMLKRLIHLLADSCIYKSTYTEKISGDYTQLTDKNYKK